MHINTHVLADVWALHKQSVSVSVCEGRYSWLTRNTTGSRKRSRACTQTDAKTKRCDCKEWWFQRKPMMQRCHHVLVMHRKIMSKCMTHGCQRQLLFFFFFFVSWSVLHVTCKECIYRKDDGVVSSKCKSLILYAHLSNLDAHYVNL